MMIFPCSVLCRLVINWFRLTFFWPLALPWLWSILTLNKHWLLHFIIWPFWAAVSWSDSLPRQTVGQLFQKFLSSMFNIVPHFILFLPIEHKKWPTFKSSHVLNSLTMFEAWSGPDNSPSWITGIEFLQHEVERWRGGVWERERVVVCGWVRSVYF